MPRLQDEIITFRNHRNREYPKSDYRSFLAIFHAKSGLGSLPKVDIKNMGPSAIARVDQGYWLVDCDACASATVVDDEDLFVICPRCGSGGRWREVIMPTERVEIEEILLMRPGFRDANLNRFWFPGEIVDQLAEENLVNGSPVPEHQQIRIRTMIEDRLKEAAEALAADLRGDL